MLAPAVVVRSNELASGIRNHHPNETILLAYLKAVRKIAHFIKKPLKFRLSSLCGS